MTLTKNMRRAKLFNSEKLYFSVQCPQEGTQVNMDGEVLRLYLENTTGKACKVFQFKCVRERSFYNASSFKFHDTNVIRKHRTVDNLRSVAYRKKKII